MTAIERIRREKGMTQSELASQVGVSQQAIAKWACGKTNPRAKLLIKISQVLNCTVDELLTSSAENPAEQS